jgi:hypothetical protein
MIINPSLSAMLSDASATRGGKYRTLGYLGGGPLLEALKRGVGISSSLRNRGDNIDETASDDVRPSSRRMCFLASETSGPVP